MRSPFFVTANDTPNHPQKERRNVAFRSMFFMGLKLQLVEIHLFSNFYYTLQKNPFCDPIASASSRQPQISHNLFDMHRFQNFPELIATKKLRKCANLTEKTLCSAKEP